MSICRFILFRGEPTQKLFPSLKCLPDSPPRGDSGDWEFGLHPLLLCQAKSLHYKLHFLLFWVIQIKGKNSKIPCTVHHSDNKQTNKYEQNNINLYVYIKMKEQSFRSHVFGSFSSFPLSRPYTVFCPLKTKLTSPLHARSHRCYSYFRTEALTPSLPPHKDNTDALHILTQSFQTEEGSPSASNPTVPPFLACISISPTSSRAAGTAAFLL